MGDTESLDRCDTTNKIQNQKHFIKDLSGANG